MLSLASRSLLQPVYRTSHRWLHSLRAPQQVFITRVAVPSVSAFLNMGRRKASTERKGEDDVVRKLSQLIKANDADGVLELYKTHKATVTGPLKTNIYMQLFRFLEGTENFEECEKVYEDMKEDGAPVVESMFTSLIRAAEGADNLPKALQYLKEMKEKKVIPRRRTYSPLLRLLAKHAKTEQCLDLAKEARDLGLVLTEEDYVVCASACVAGNEPQAFQRVLHEMAEELLYLSKDTVTQLRTLFEQFGWKTSIDTLAPDGTFMSSGKKLKSIPIPPSEHVALTEETKQLATTTQFRADAFRVFEEWLQKRQAEGPIDVIVDGANLGHHGQNFKDGVFRFSYVKAVVDYYKRRGKNVLVVMHERWFMEKTPLAISYTAPDAHTGADVQALFGGDAAPTGGARKRQRVTQNTSEEQKAGDAGKQAGFPVTSSDDSLDEEMALLCPIEGKEEDERQMMRDIKDEWTESGLLFQVPRGSNDDWFWLYAALKSGNDVKLVSNDQMRDHHFDMLAPRTFLLWRERHQVYFRVKFCHDLGGVLPVLQEPPPYSARAQCEDVGSTWFFPQRNVSVGRPSLEEASRSLHCPWLIATKP